MGGRGSGRGRRSGWVGCRGQDRVPRESRAGAVHPGSSSLAPPPEPSGSRRRSPRGPWCTRTHGPCTPTAEGGWPRLLALPLLQRPHCPHGHGCGGAFTSSSLGGSPLSRAVQAHRSHRLPPHDHRCPLAGLPGGRPGPLSLQPLPARSRSQSLPAPPELLASRGPCAMCLSARGPFSYCCAIRAGVTDRCSAAVPGLAGPKGRPGTAWARPTPRWRRGASMGLGAQAVSAGTHRHLLRPPRDQRQRRDPVQQPRLLSSFTPNTPKQPGAGPGPPPGDGSSVWLQAGPGRFCWGHTNRCVTTGPAPGTGGLGTPTQRSELTVPAVCPGSGWRRGTPAARYNSGPWRGKQSSGHRGGLTAGQGPEEQDPGPGPGPRDASSGLSDAPIKPGNTVWNVCAPLPPPDRPLAASPAAELFGGDTGRRGPGRTPPGTIPASRGEHPKCTRLQLREGQRGHEVIPATSWPAPGLWKVPSGGCWPVGASAVYQKDQCF